MTPGQEAVAALYDNGEGEASLILIDDDGTVYIRPRVAIREARHAIDLAVERAIDNIEAGNKATNPRRIRGGHWAIRLKCPDGKVRLFVERRSTRVSNRRPVSMALRWELLVRDGFRCRYCGRSSPDVALAIDHIIPVARGGTDDPSNLTVACVDCNGGKSDRLPVRLPAARKSA